MVTIHMPFYQNRVSDKMETTCIHDVFYLTIKHHHEQTTMFYITQVVWDMYDFANKRELPCISKPNGNSVITTRVKL